MKTAAIIVAAGSGERFGADLKQLVAVGGRPMLAWSVSRFAACRNVNRIVLVAPPGRVGEIRAAAGSDDARVTVVVGGDTRQESVRRGLEALAGDIDTVLIHDAARPCVTGDLIDRAQAAALEHGAAVPVVPAVDTLVLYVEGAVDAVVDRAHIGSVQTPQAFAVDRIRRAHASARSRGFLSSDDGSLVFALGERVVTIPGERTNIKITYPEDVAIAAAILSSQSHASNPTRE